MSTPAKDTALRALTKDGGFRVIAVSTTSTVRGAIRAQKVDGSLAILFAEVLTAAILVRESMSPEFRVQVVLQGQDGRSRLIADALPGGITRGLVQAPAGTIGLGEGAFVQVQRTMANGEVHTGVVAYPAGASIAEAVMSYMLESEQIPTMISVGAHPGAAPSDEIAAAGGLLLQLLPEVERQKLMVMTERMEDFKDIRPLLAQGKADPKTLVEETFWGMEYVQTSEADLAFGCHCSPARLAASLSTLPKADIEEMIADGKPLEITCDFCGTEYEFHPTQLRGLLTAN